MDNTHTVDTDRTDHTPEDPHAGIAYQRRRMFLDLDHQAAAPIYRQIVDGIKYYVATGRLSAGHASVAAASS